MVDFESYLHHNPEYSRHAPMGSLVYSNSNDECGCATCSANPHLIDNQKTHYDRVTKNDDFEETQYLLCPPRVLGYWLSGRSWMELDISEIEGKPGAWHLEYIAEKKSSEAFDKLELDDKDLIKRLVLSHTSSSGKKPLMEDIMKDKGKGLVILLHGRCLVKH
jgi:hypothetical protein